MALDSSPDPLPHGTQYVMDNQRPGTSTSQLAGSDVYRQVTATVPNLNPYEDAQASSLTAMQTQPHVPGAQGPAPVPWPVSPHGGGVEEQQPMLHDCAGAFNASGDLASASAGPAAQGVSRGMGWTGRLHWDGRCIHAQAKAAEAVLNPYAHAFVKLLSLGDLHLVRRKLSEWPDDLQLEPVADPELSTLDSQAWMRKTKPPMALLRCICDTDNCDFDQLIEALSNGHGVSRSSRWHPALAVSRFDSTQPSGGRNTARPWSDSYLWQLAKPFSALHFPTPASWSDRSPGRHSQSASRGAPQIKTLKSLRKVRSPNQDLSLIPLWRRRPHPYIPPCHSNMRDYTLRRRRMG